MKYLMVIFLSVMLFGCVAQGNLDNVEKLKKIQIHQRLSSFAVYNTFYDSSVRSIDTDRKIAIYNIKYAYGFSVARSNACCAYIITQNDTVIYVLWNAHEDQE